MGIDKLWSYAQKEGITDSVRSLKPTNMTIVDTNSYFYVGHSEENDEPFLFSNHDFGLSKECPQMQQFIEENNRVMESIESTMKKIPLPRDKGSTAILTFDGRPPCMKWKTQKFRHQKISDTCFGLKPWTCKAVHLSRFIENWITRPKDAEDTFQKYYERIIIGDITIPGEGDYKIGEYIVLAFQKYPFLLEPGETVTVITEDSDMLVHLLYIWAVHLDRRCNIQIISRCGSLDVKKWRVLHIDRLAETFQITAAVTDKERIEVTLSNVAFLVSLFGNDYVPQVSGFPLTAERIKTIAIVANRATNKVYTNVEIFKLAMQALEQDTKKKKVASTRIISPTTIQDYIRCVLWSTGNYKHCLVPWTTDEMVKLANNLDAAHVSTITFADLIHFCSTCSEQEFSRLSQFDPTEPATTPSMEYWYLSYLFQDPKDLTIPTHDLFLNSVNLQSKQHRWLVSKIRECSHYDQKTNRIQYSVPLHEYNLMKDFIKEYTDTIQRRFV